MKPKRRQQLLDVVTPHLGQGERVEVMTLARVESISWMRKVVTTAVAGAIVGKVAMARKPRPMYIALTDRRILFVEQNGVTGGVNDKLLMTWERAAVTTGKTGTGPFGLVLTVDLGIMGHDRGVRMTFPYNSRDDGRQLIAALPAS